MWKKVYVKLLTFALVCMTLLIYEHFSFRAQCVSLLIIFEIILILLKNEAGKVLILFGCCLTLKAFRVWSVEKLKIKMFLHSSNVSISGPSGKAVRQYFPYVSSETDLQRYRAISFHKNPSADTKTSSSISNVPSDSTGKTRVSQCGFEIFFCLRHRLHNIFLKRFYSYMKICFLWRDLRRVLLELKSQRERFCTVNMYTLAINRGANS